MKTSGLLSCGMARQSYGFRHHHEQLFGAVQYVVARQRGLWITLGLRNRRRVACK